ncbi:acetolactate synthase 2 small subunit [Psychromonas antarctica]|jgi:acetolactate synthase II small subunit|uniref:acetolactate synthase 2 small subunit n=1 Tax=Psychromonas antarctica TaxID=67573 RepID=UPI001EE803F3|nr:acetolactate synthase 2 small subunit [Psychromonas antarctica]MCG6201943.1 acetolactate synthase 2 small subunit [Psychromonas antarctica]
MKYLLIIQGENSPELLERLLRVCRHRGFSVQKISGETTENEKSLHITLTVCSDRPVSLLSKQIDKLFGITQVVAISQEQAIRASA